MGQLFDRGAVVNLGTVRPFGLQATAADAGVDFQQIAALRSLVAHSARCFARQAKQSGRLKHLVQLSEVVETDCRLWQRLHLSRNFSVAAEVTQQAIAEAAARDAA